MLCIKIYDNKDINTESTDFKNKIADSAKELILRDWDKITEIRKYTETNNNIKEYYVDVKL